MVWFCLFVASAAVAAPPPGHPTPAEAERILGLPAKPDSALPNVGIVEQAIDSNQYTYVEVRTEAGTTNAATIKAATIWLAVTKMALAPGDKVRYADGARMANFYSKVLKRTFPEILFVGNIVRE